MLKRIIAIVIAAVMSLSFVGSTFASEAITTGEEYSESEKYTVTEENVITEIPETSNAEEISSAKEENEITEGTAAENAETSGEISDSETSLPEELPAEDESVSKETEEIIETENTAENAEELETIKETTEETETSAEAEETLESVSEQSLLAYLDSSKIPAVQGIKRNADGDFILYWDAVDGIDHYEVLANVSYEIDGISYIGSEIIASTTDTEADVSSYCSNGYSQVFDVRSVDANGNISKTATYNYTYHAPALTLEAKCSWDDATNISIEIVDWQSTKEFDSIEIYRKKGDEEYTKIKTFKYKTGRQYSFTDAPGESGIYTYQIRYNVDEYTGIARSEVVTFIKAPVIKSIKFDSKTHIATVELEEADSTADYYYFGVEDNESYLMAPHGMEKWKIPAARP